MAVLILARHGRTAANATHVLAGRSSGVFLDETGEQQAATARDRLSGVPLVDVVSSPLERCRQTARILAAGRGLRVHTDRRLTECDYGDWTGRPMKELVKEDLWKVVQAQPSAVTFPGGEAMAAMSARAVAAARDHDARVEAVHGGEAIWLAVSHGDVIKSILADALGLHLDAFQRIMVDPASLSVVRYTSERSYVLASNTRAGDLGHLVTKRAEAPEETLGGGAG